MGILDEPQRKLAGFLVAVAALMASYRRVPVLPTAALGAVLVGEGAFILHYTAPTWLRRSALARMCFRLFP